MVPALRTRKAKPVSERCTNNQGGHGFDSRQLHFKKRGQAIFLATFSFGSILVSICRGMVKSFPQIDCFVEQSD